VAITSKDKGTAEPVKPKTIQAVCVVKTGDILCKSYSLTIVDNVVVSSTEITRAENTPALAIGVAQHLLWAQWRVNRDLPR